MINMRFAKASDKEDFIRIWKKCFKDSKTFTDWIFNTRFLPEYSVCLSLDDKIVTAIQSLPLFVSIRGKIIPSAMVMGVSTDPEYGGRGFMKMLYRYYMENIASLGIVAVPLKPDRLETYYFAGHYPVNDVAFIEGITSKENKFENVAIGDSKILPSIYKVYNEFSKNYSAIVARSYGDFLLKSTDYLCDGGSLAFHKENGVIDGYIYYYNSEDLIYGEEVCFLNKKALENIKSYIASLSDNKPYKLKVPREFGEKPIPRNVMGIASVARLLKFLGLNSDLPIKINDNVVLENNDTFTLRGDKTKATPALELDIQYFTQLICGYKSVYELIKEDNIKVVSDNCILEVAKLLPKVDTFMYDEY